MIKKINQKTHYYLLPFLLGSLTSFSLPPYNIILINFITFPALLFILIELQKKTNSLWLNFKIGWLFGIGYFLSNIYWIVYSLTFEDIFKPLIPLALIIIPSFLGLFYGIITLVVSRIKLQKNFSSILIFSLVFGVIEFIRGFILGGFPWNLIVYSWTNYLNSLQILSIIGTYSLNLISITIFAFPLLIIFQKKKRFFEYNNENAIIEELVELSNPDISQKTIFVFPEGALAGINLDKLKSFKEIFSNRFSDLHTIIMGINTNRIENNSSKIFNSMVVLDNKLNLLNEYNKNKLVPFGEFLPMEKFLKKFGLKKISHGYQSFSPGNERKVIFTDNKNFNFIPLVCYEIIYSGKVKSKSSDTNFIINISEDGWFGNSIGPHQHFSHTIYRAIEEGKNIIRSANNGISAYIDSNGIIISKLESTKKGVIEINNYKKFNETLFSKFGNKIFFYILLFYVSLIFFIKRWENK